MSGFTGWKEGPDSCLDFLTHSGVPPIDTVKGRQQEMSDNSTLQKAADEARKVARAARELGGYLDNYAKYLTQPYGQERAEEMHSFVLSRLGVINDGLATCNIWVTKSSKSSVAQPPEQMIKSEVIGKQGVLELGEPRAVQIKKKGSMN
jgi:hypothetical protein